MSCNYLAKKLCEWFDESKDFKNEKDFTFRFRGKESFNYLQNFPKLIDVLVPKIKDVDSIFKLSQVFYQSIQLRKLISFSVRIENITKERTTTSILDSNLNLAPPVLKQRWMWSYAPW